MARAHAPPPPPPVPIISIEKLKRNGAQEFYGDQIANPLIAKRWQERTVRVLENLKVPLEDWGQHAIFLLQDAAYDWWKRVGTNIPVPIPWATFDPLFREEYVPDHYVETKYEEFSKFTQGKLTLPKYLQQFDRLAEFGKDLVNTMEKRCKKFIKGMRPDLSSSLIIVPRADINDVYKKALEVNEELIRKTVYDQALLVESQAVQSGLKMGHGSKRTLSAPSNSRHDKRAKSTPSASVAVTSKSGKEKVTYRNPVCSLCGRRHPGECWFTQGLCLGCGQAGKVFLADLIELPHKEFDIILGMDWLTEHQAIVECKAQVVKLRTDDGNEVIIRGELLPKAPEFISYMQAKRLIRRKCEAFLCTVKDMQKETPNHKDISVVCDFPNVFPEELPGLPPPREVEFSIDLVPAYSSADPERVVCFTCYTQVTILIMEPIPEVNESDEMYRLVDHNYYALF
ncbi:unnamed protein product [Cuscuta campestris]|uniref:Retrotransposon gag domain-containing protein n=1 Tax=Cuscuta campestris TaxID=132261 RepID=A0A484MM85_9ASTE|nr:unnamed protein product [Cuscuta campestris]